jgi:beta-lactamase regulating signal transducer with metallopeptidase domain
VNEIRSVLADWAAVWSESLWRAAWQGGIAILAVWLVIRCVPKLSSRVAMWLLRIASLKLLITLCWAVPLAVPVLSPPPPVSQIGSTPLEFATLSLEPIHDRSAETPPAAPPRSSIAQPPAPPPSPQIGWPVLLMGVWLVGVAWQIGRIVRAGLTAGRQVLRASPAVPESLQEAFARQARRMKVAYLPRLLMGDPFENPFLAGWIRPAIVLPRDIETRFSPAEIDLILAHELGHLVRRDLFWNWLPAVAQSLFFFHPLVWLLARQWSESQEAACDELVLTASEVRASDYGKMLVHVATTQTTLRLPMLTTAGVLGSYDELERRIRSLEHVRRRPSRARTLLAMGIVCGGVLGLVPWRLTERAQTAVAAEEVRLTEGEWQQHVVRIRAWRGNSMHKDFPAVVIESSGGSSYLLSASWGAEPFPEPFGPVLKLEILGSDDIVEIVDYDEAAGIGIFRVAKPLLPVPEGAFGGQVRAGDVLTELRLPEGEKTTDHTVQSTGQDLRRKTATGDAIVVRNTIVLAGGIRAKTNHPGSPFIQGGRLVALSQDNARGEDGKLHSYLLPIASAREAYARLRKLPEWQWGSKAGPKRLPQPGDYRRPELVALAWDTTEGDRKALPTAWRPDGSLLGEAEVKQLAIDIGGFAIDHWKQSRGRRPLVLVFRLDDRVRREQAITCNVRLDGDRKMQLGSARNSTKGLLAVSSIEPDSNTRFEWPERMTIEARVPVDEPALIKEVEAPGWKWVTVDRGVRWYVDPDRGIRTIGDQRQSGFPAAVLEKDRRLADPLASIWDQITTKDGKPLRGYGGTFLDSVGAVEINFSNPIDEANPIQTVKFYKRNYRLETYEGLPTHLELRPKDDPPPPAAPGGDVFR